jgi:hypothetical protein
MGCLLGRRLGLIECLGAPCSANSRSLRFRCVDFSRKRARPGLRIFKLAGRYRFPRFAFRDADTIQRFAEPLLGRRQILDSAPQARVGRERWEAPFDRPDPASKRHQGFCHSGND